MISSMPLSEKLAKAEKVRREAKKDLYFFCREILGYDAMTIKPHKELCDFISKSKKNKRLILMPRGSFKSSVVTIGYSLWRLINDPNLRILISSETYAQSKTFLKAIKSHIEQNELFIAVFGDLRPASLDVAWRQEEITIAGRTRVGREGSIMCTGAEMERTGFHFDIIIMDDIVGPTNSNTADQIQKTIDHYKMMLSILEPNGEINIVGTRYHFSDLYGHVLDEEGDTFSIHKRSAILEDGSLLFPSRLTRDFLDAQKKSQGSSIFYNQYMNEPIDQESAMFKHSWIKYYDMAPKNLRRFMVLDPSGSQKNSADFNGITITGIDCQNNIFVLEAINDKSTIGDLIDLIFRKIEEYKINEEGCLGLETTAMQQTLKFIFSEEMNKRGFFFSIKELKPHTNKSKINRVKALQPYFENGKIWLKKDQTELIDQITRFPKTKHDDLVDSLAYHLEIASPADIQEIDRWDGCNLPYHQMRIWQSNEERKKPRFINRKRHRL